MKMQTNMKLFQAFGAGIFFMVMGLVCASVRLEAADMTEHSKHSETVEKMYYCPMHPHITSPKPGDCPICHMRLVLWEGVGAIGGEPNSASVSGYSEVSLSSEKQQLIGVKTEPVVRQSLHKIISASGKIAYDPMLYQAQAEYIQALRSTEGVGWADMIKEGARTKLVLMGLNEDLIADIGRRTEPDKTLLYATAGDEVWVYAALFEYEMNDVKVGDEMVVQASSMPGLMLQGMVKAMDSVVDPVSRTVRVRGMVKNEQGVLKPDMFVNVDVHVAMDPALVVPEEAVLLTGKQSLVFVEKEPGLFEPRHVVVKTKVQQHYVVEEGLQEGELVVTHGNFFIDSESRLRAALKGAAEGHAHD